MSVYLVKISLLGYGFRIIRNMHPYVHLNEYVCMARTGMCLLSCEIIFRVIYPETKDVVPWQECSPSLCEAWVQAPVLTEIKR